MLRASIGLAIGIILLSHAGSVNALASTHEALSVGTELTESERAWLAANHTVRARVTNYPPYMVTSPVPSGIAVDYLSAVAKRYGFRVEFVADSIGFPASVSDLSGPHQHYDLMLTFTRTAEREKIFAITIDYLTAPWVVYARRDRPYIIGLESLGGKIVAGEKGYVITGKIKTDYPEVHVLEVAKSEEALLAVATGQADAYVGNLANASYIVKANRFDNLVVTAPTPYGINTQAMAVRRDWPELARLIDKGILAMSSEERNVISQKWGAIEFKPTVDYTLVWQISAGAISVLLAFGFWNRKLTKQVALRRQAELLASESARQLATEKDLLEQRVAERTAHLSEALIFNECILLNSPLPMGIYSATGQCIMANESYAMFVGATREDLLAQNFFNIPSWKTGGLLIACEQALNHHALQRNETHLTTSFGKNIWFEYRILPSNINGHDHLLIQFVDLTERKIMEEALHASELLLQDKMAQLQVILDNSSVGIVFVRDMHIQWANQRMCELFGYSISQLEGICTKSLYVCEEDYIRTGYDAYSQLENNKRYTSELMMRHNDGHSIWVRMTGSPVRGDYAITGSIWVFEDITEQKIADAELRSAKEASDAASRAKSEFLANMSHEIRTPMNAILGLSNILRRSELNPDQSKCLETITHSGKLLLNIINDILDYSKIEAGKLEIEHTEFSLRTTLNSLEAVVVSEKKSNELEFYVKVSVDVSDALIGDSLRLQQILVNLTSNAQKFTESGRVAIHVYVINKTKNEIKLRFEVQDTGIGIAPDVIKRLFSPFCQADESTTRRFGGTGLGLAICKRLAQLMEGDIGVESTLGSGSTFWFTASFGLADSKPEVPGQPSCSRIKDGSKNVAYSRDVLFGISILLVEDNAINQDVARRVLEFERATVTVANNGLEAINFLQDRKIKYDIILMDIQMPVMDGYEATKYIRNQLGLSNIPVIALTAGVMESDRQMAIAAGVDGFIPKPFDVSLLVSTVARHCSKGDAGELSSVQLCSEADCIIDFNDGLKRSSGDIEFYDVNLRRFVEQFSSFNNDVCNLFNDGNIIEASRQIHLLRGVAGNIGARRLCQCAADIEINIRANPTDVQHLDLEGLAALTSDTLGLVETFRKSISHNASVSQNRNRESIPMSGLVDMLRANDISAIEAFASLEESIKSIIGDEACLIMKRNLENLEYQKVLTDMVGLISND